MKRIKTTCHSTILPAIMLLLAPSPLFLQDEFLDEARVGAGQPFVASNPPVIAELDPPPDGNLYATGLVFEEYNCIGGDKYYDDGVWAFMALPRGNVYRHPLQIWDRNSVPRIQVPYDYGQYAYSSGCIHPPLPVPVPVEGQYIAGLNVLHKVDGLASWPQVLVVNSDGYLRLTAEPPRTFGTSYRLATHNVGGTNPAEEFPVLVKTATQMMDQDTAVLNFLIDGEAYTGALQSRFTPGPESAMEVKGVFIMRRSLVYADEQNTGFAGMSSMFWKGEDDTPANEHDEAHDADILTITYSDGTTTEYPLYSHLSGDQIVVHFPPPAGSSIVSFALEQRDRDPAHYSDYASASYATRISLAIENITSSVPLQLTLHIFPTTSEYQDNIVAHLTITKDLDPGQEVTLSYRIRAY